MIKKLFTMAVVLAVIGQGIARADDPGARGVTMVQDRAALAVHIDALEQGDRVAVATDDGVVSGEIVDRDADDLVIDQPLIQGGAERIIIPRREIQGVRYQQTAAHQPRISVNALVTIAVVVGVFFVVVAHLMPGP